jgi:hypothetical protein
MPRESTIQILRSTGTDTPTGLTFGELAYSDVNEKLFVGDAAGNSIWVGAQVTSGSLSTNSQYAIPTQSAVKTYVDGIVGGGSVVNSLNGTGGNLTVTGSGAITQTVSGTTTTFGARFASTSVTGVASFSNTHFTVDTTGHVKLAAAYQVTGDTVQAGSFINIGAGKTINNIGVQTFNGLTGAVSFTVPLATTSLTGTASFNPNRFQVSLTGNVDLLAAFQVTGQTVVSGGSSQLVSTSGNTVTIDNRIATSSVTGVASFNGTRFTVSAAGLVDLAAAYQVTGDTVQAGSFINIGAGKTINNIGVQTFNGLTGAITITGDGGSQSVVGNNTITNRVATATLTGVAAFNSTYYSVSAAGLVTPTAPFQVTGQTVVSGGPSLLVSTSGNTVTIDNRIASASVTGVASFSSSNFNVSTAGLVTLSSNTIGLKASSADSGSTVALGGSITITGAANQIDVSRSTTTFTIGLPNDVTIPGNLTVNGTVVTANVDSFVVEDPLIMLGTGNAADSVDLGFYGQYTSSGKRFAGIFRDASDSGKFKFFTGLSGGVEPTTFVNDAGSGYSVATVVAKIDGGTF